MKIVFLCSSLEPGRDGAGDQARSLAGELIRQGHQVAAVSIHDHEFAHVIEDNQEVEGIALTVLRIPSSWKSNNCYSLLSDWIKKFNPDWVSLQFVSFGYHRYGLPWKMLLHLRPAIGNAKLNIMFQELWCGMGDNCGIKEKLLGITQKAFIKSMLSKLRPESVFTNIAFYQNKLDQLGVKSALAPVFGNIPLNDLGNDEEWDKLVSEVALEPLYKTRDNWLVLGFFGTIYPCAGLEKLLQSAAEAANQMERQLGILIIGQGRRGQDIRIMAQNIPGSTCWQTGMLTPEMVNRAMHLVDMGVITTTSIGLNKSSTASAWLERGIPVLISPGDNTYCKSEMLSKGVCQVVETTDVLLAFELKGRLLSKNRFKEIVATYSELELL